MTKTFSLMLASSSYLIKNKRPKIQNHSPCLVRVPRIGIPALVQLGLLVISGPTVKKPNNKIATVTLKVTNTLKSKTCPSRRKRVRTETRSAKKTKLKLMETT